MPDDSSSGLFSRRHFLGSAALGAAVVREAMAQSPENVQKAVHDHSSSTPIGPDNPPLHDENPDSVVPPISDYGNINTF
jgi:hypothetical protein